MNIEFVGVNYAWDIEVRAIGTVVMELSPVQGVSRMLAAFFVPVLLLSVEQQPKSDIRRLTVEVSTPHTIRQKHPVGFLRTRDHTAEAPTYKTHDKERDKQPRLQRDPNPRSLK